MHLLGGDQREARSGRSASGGRTRCGCRCRCGRTCGVPARAHGAAGPRTGCRWVPRCPTVPEGHGRLLTPATHSLPGPGDSARPRDEGAGGDLSVPSANALIRSSGKTWPVSSLAARRRQASASPRTDVGPLAGPYGDEMARGPMVAGDDQPAPLPWAGPSWAAWRACLRRSVAFRPLRRTSARAPPAAAGAPGHSAASAAATKLRVRSGSSAMTSGSTNVAAPARATYRWGQLAEREVPVPRQLRGRAQRRPVTYMLDRVLRHRQVVATRGCARRYPRWSRGPDRALSRPGAGASGRIPASALTAVGVGPPGHVHGELELRLADHLHMERHHLGHAPRVRRPGRAAAQLTGPASSPEHPVELRAEIAGAGHRDVVQFEPLRHEPSSSASASATTAPSRPPRRAPLHTHCRTAGRPSGRPGPTSGRRAERQDVVAVHALRGGRVDLEPVAEAEDPLVRGRSRPASRTGSAARGPGSGAAGAPGPAMRLRPSGDLDRAGAHPRPRARRSPPGHRRGRAGSSRRRSFSVPTPSARAATGSARASPRPGRRGRRENGGGQHRSVGRRPARTTSSGAGVSAR